MVFTVSGAVSPTECLWGMMSSFSLVPIFRVGPGNEATHYWYKSDIASIDVSLFFPHTPTPSHSYLYTRTLPLLHIHTFTPTHSHSLTFIPLHPHTPTSFHLHTHLPSHTLTPSHPHTHSSSSLRSPSHPHTLTLSYSHFLSPSHSHLTPSHSHSLTPSHSHLTSSHSHSLTPSHSHPHTPSVVLILSRPSKLRPRGYRTTWERGVPPSMETLIALSTSTKTKRESFDWLMGIK